MQDGLFETAPRDRIAWQFGHAMLGERRAKRGIECSFCRERFFPEPRFLNPMRAMRQLQGIPLPCDICWDRLPGEEQMWFLESMRLGFEGLAE